MFAKIAGFELRYQTRSPVFWVAFSMFFLLTFGATTIPQIHIGSNGNTHVNAPYALLQELGFMSVFAIFALTAFVANVVVRDDETGYGRIIRSTQITKFDYLFGRFTGAFTAGALTIVSLPLGIVVSVKMPWLDPLKVGPFRPEDYLYAYTVILLPPMFVLGVGLLFLGVAYFSYHFEMRGAKNAKEEKSEAIVVRVRARPLPAPHFDTASTLTQSWKWTRFEMAQVFKSPVFFVLLALWLLNAIGGLSFATEQRDNIVLPVTNLMITTLYGSFTIILMIVAIYYSGELVRRERDRRTHEMFDACPVPDWAFVVPKILAISFVLIAMIAISVLAGVGV